MSGCDSVILHEGDWQAVPSPPALSTRKAKRQQQQQQLQLQEQQQKQEQH